MKRALFMRLLVGASVSSQVGHKREDYRLTDASSLQLWDSLLIRL